MLCATPVVNLLSRHHERRADRYALALTERPAAFVSAMRRLGAQNLAEANPSRARGVAVPLAPAGRAAHLGRMGDRR